MSSGTLTLTWRLSVDGGATDPDELLERSRERIAEAIVSGESHGSVTETVVWDDAMPTPANVVPDEED